MKALVEYMKLAEISQSELARRLGVHQGMVNHWLHGRRKPTVASLKLLSKETGLSLEKLSRDL